MDRNRIPKPLTAKDIQHALNRKFRLENKIYFNNHEIGGWSESDVFMITEAMVTTEFEIKISHSDFLADYKKTVWQRGGRRPNKHSVLTGGQGTSTPTKFAFACPKDLISIDEIHERYGLYYIYEDDYIEQVRAAKPLNKNRFTQEQLNHELWKFWGKQTWKTLFSGS